MTDEALTGPAGWYPDPQGIAHERYWDGTTWTPKTREEPRPRTTETSKPTHSTSTVSPAAPPPAVSASVSSAAKASMEYLHSITLVLMSGVIAGALIPVGIFAVASNMILLGILLIPLGAIFSVAFLIGAFVALYKADSYNKRA